MISDWSGPEEMPQADVASTLACSRSMVTTAPVLRLAKLLGHVPCKAPLLAQDINPPGLPYAIPAGMLLGIAGNVMKQNAIYPPPTDPDMATEEEAGRRECVCVCLHGYS